MNTPQLIVALERRGLQLSLQDGRLRVDGPLDDWAREQLGLHAEDIVRRLPHRPTPVRQEGEGESLADVCRRLQEHSSLETRARQLFSTGPSSCRVVRELSYAQVHFELREAAKEAWGALDQVERTRRMRGAMLEVAGTSGHPWAWRLYHELDWWCDLFGWPWEQVEADSPAVVG